MSNLISGKKTYTFGGEKGVYQNRREYLTEEILKYPAVIIKGVRDDLIEMNLNSDPPVFKWKKEVVDLMPEIELTMLNSLLEKRLEAGIK